MATNKPTDAPVDESHLDDTVATEISTDKPDINLSDLLSNIDWSKIDTSDLFDDYEMDRFFTEMIGTNEPTYTPVDQLQLYDNVATEITDIFDPLIQQLVARRDTLLYQVQIMREHFLAEEPNRKAAIEELERKIQQTKEEGLRVNMNLGIQDQIIQLYQDLQKQHQTPKLPHPFFCCEKLYQLQTHISEFGEVRKWELDYSLKKEPVLTVGSVRIAFVGQLARGLAIDEPNQLMYIADCTKNRIQLVSFAGKFLRRFGQGVVKGPSGIAVTEDHVYISDFDSHALFQFCKKDYTLVKRTGTEGKGEGQLDFPCGVCTDYNRDVYVADRNNHRVSVFTKDLHFLSCLYYRQVRFPHDVKATLSCIVVLDRSAYCVHFFSRSGILVRSCVSCGEEGMVNGPRSFCLDPAENMIIADYINDHVKVFSPSGQLIHTIATKGYLKGECIGPSGVCLSQNGTIFVVSESNIYPIQLY